MPRLLPLAPPSRMPPRSVRVSLTDRCDLACVYCRPSRRDGYQLDRLDGDEFERLLGQLRAAGVERVRFTGGEPLLSPHVTRLVARARALGFHDVALTTNGTRLRELAGPLRDAGLDRLTLSLDSLDTGRFRRLTRGGDLGRVLAGLEAALAAGFGELKLNVVVLRGENDDELEALTRFAWERGIVPRFIEVMPIAEGAVVGPERLVPAAEIWSRLAPLLQEAEPEIEPDRGPARYRRSIDDPSRRVGVISGSTDTYCDGCDRLRVTAQGQLRPCLATPTAVDARPTLSQPDTAFQLALQQAWQQKPDGRSFAGCTEESARTVSMRAIGG